MGVPFSIVTESEALDYIVASHRAGLGGAVFAANLDVVRQCDKKPEVKDLFQTASLLVGDGMPIVWASRVQGQPLPERLPTSQLITAFAERAAKEGLSTFYLGGNPGAAEACAKAYQERWPTLKVAGTHSPPVGFEKNPEEMDRIRQMLLQTKPDMVYVGLGVPKQELLIDTLRKDFPKTWFMATGISFSFVAGEVKRAPVWVQRAGAEWIVRLVQEPKRLFRRYIIDDLPFLGPLILSALRNRKTT